MPLKEALFEALTALRAHKLRALLTMLGIIIGVSAVIAMVAIGGGARETVIARIKTLGANLFVISPGNVVQGGVRLGIGASSTLSEDDAIAIEKEVAAVRVTAPLVFARSQILATGANWSTSVVGVTFGWFIAREWDVAEGRSFEPDEVNRGALVIILGETVKKNLFQEENAIGETVRVRGVPFKIIGTLASKGQSALGQDQDDVVVVPLITAQNRVLGRNRANSRAVHNILVKINDGENMETAGEEITTLLRQKHKLQDSAENDFNLRNLAEVSSIAEGSAKTLSLLLAAVAGISLLVGGIGIMNIMLVSVSERTREIGLRLALGARPRDIRNQFLIEAVTLSAIGGLIGIALGLSAAKFTAYKLGWPLLLEPLTVVIAVVFSGVVGIFFGWYPAMRASKLDPIIALRSPV
jgi:putative ABC transport system permease protein